MIKAPERRAQQQHQRRQRPGHRHAGKQGRAQFRRIEFALLDHVLANAKVAYHLGQTGQHGGN